jgi:hypothetical protein
MNQPVVNTRNSPQQKVFQMTTVETVKDSDSDAYENVYISEGDDICETEESDPVVSKRIRSGSSSDSNSEETVLQTYEGRQEIIHGTKCKCVISNCESEWKRKQPFQKSPKIRKYTSS